MKEIFFWFQIAFYFLSSYWIFIVIFIAILIWLGRKAFNYLTIETTFWVFLSIFILSNGYFLYQSYDSIVQGQSDQGVKKHYILQ